MGLDMYLNRRIYIGANYEHNNVKGTISLTSGKDNTPIKIDLSKVTEIVEQVGYWRKANQIHKWFVDNVQDGEDDCKEYYVSKEDLEKLLADCKAVISNKELATEKLPTQSGFFFGSTDYDEYYMQEIEETIDIIEPLINEDASGDIYYKSSW